MFLQAWQLLLFPPVHNKHSWEHSWQILFWSGYSVIEHWATHVLLISWTRFEGHLAKQFVPFITEGGLHYDKQVLVIGSPYKFGLSQIARHFDVVLVR